MQFRRWDGIYTAFVDKFAAADSERWAWHVTKSAAVTVLSQLRHKIADLLLALRGRDDDDCSGKHGRKSSYWDAMNSSETHYEPFSGSHVMMMSWKIRLFAPAVLFLPSWD